MAAPSLIPPRRRKPSTWAHAELHVPDGPRAGQRLELFAFQTEILDSLGTDDVQEVDVIGSSQWGKTLILLVYCGWTIAEDPCRVLYVMPSDQGAGGAKEFSRERLAPFIRETPCIRARVHGKRSSAGSNTMSSKTFDGGSISLVGARAPAGLASRPIRRALLDEVDRFPVGVGTRSAKSEKGYSSGEGSVRAVAATRTGTFGRRRTIAQVSSPVNVGGPIHSGFLAGDQRRFFVSCPGCGERGILGWLGVDFDLVNLLEPDQVDRPPRQVPAPIVAAVEWHAADGSDAALVCRSCRRRWSDLDRDRAVAGGEWVAENPAAPPGRRSYHIWAAYSPLSRLAELAAEYVAAVASAEAGDTGELTTFRQTKLGLPVASGGIVAPELERLRAALLEHRGKGPALPDDFRVVGSVDVHGDRLEMLVTAWSKDDEACWPLEHLILPGRPDESDVWETLDAYRAGSFGGKQIERLHIDSGYLPDHVYAYVLPRQRDGVAAVKGYSDRPLVTPAKRPEKGLKGRPCWLFLVGTDVAKSVIYAKLAEGQIHLPDLPWCGAEFVAQLTSEKTEVIRHRGQNIRRWVTIRERNEALDLMVYALHARRWLR